MKIMDNIIWMILCVGVFCFGIGYGIIIAQRESVNVGSGTMMNGRYMHIVGTELIPEQPMFKK